jgi:hypothetical protein
MTFEEYVNQVASSIGATVEKRELGYNIKNEEVSFDMSLVRCTVTAQYGTRHFNEARINARMGDPEKFINRINKELIPQIIETKRQEDLAIIREEEKKRTIEERAQMIRDAGGDSVTEEYGTLVISSEKLKAKFYTNTSKVSVDMYDVDNGLVVRIVQFIASVK